MGDRRVAVDEVWGSCPSGGCECWSRREGKHARTPRSWRLDRRSRGTTVTSSISQRKAISVGSRPGLEGCAIAVVAKQPLGCLLGIVFESPGD